MKKKISKLFSMLLATVMVLSMAMTGLAAEVQPYAHSGDDEDAITGSITIDNAAPGEEYTIYQIFEMTYVDFKKTSDEDESDSYSYKVVDEWLSYIQSKSDLFTIEQDNDGNYYVTADSGIFSADAETIATFARDALAYANSDEGKAAGIEGTTRKADTTDGTKNEDGTYTIKFDKLSLGYYLVDTSLGTLCMLTSTDADVEIHEKNEEPVPTKTVNHVKDESDPNNALVEFEVDIDHISGISNLVFHDEMPEEELLLYENDDYPDESITVTLMERTGEDTEPNKIKEMTEGTDYVIRIISENVPCSDNDASCTFEIDFSLYDFSGCTEDYYIEVIYDALIDTTGDEYEDDGEVLRNDVVLTYGIQGHSVRSYAEVDLFGFEIKKFTGEGDDEKLLADAQFELKNENGSGTAYFYYEEDNNIYLFEGWKGTADVSDEYTTTLVSDETGMIKIEGLEEGTYTLTETKAPDGYNRLTYDIIVTIKAELKADDEGYDTLDSFTVTYIPSDADDEDEPSTADGNIIPIENNQGAKLPGTGSIGTTIFYVVGIILVLGAAVLFVTKKRLDKEQ